MYTLSWTPIEDNLIRENYREQSKVHILNLIPGRSWGQIQRRASFLKVSKNIRKNNLEKLLQDTPEAAYWMGFIFADGSISDPSGTLSASQSGDDRTHISILAEFLGIKAHTYTKYNDGLNNRFSRKGYTTFSQLAVKDKTMIPLIRQRFDLKPRKTYNPPTFLPYEDPELLKCWLIGFIDGDGTTYITKAYKYNTIEVKIDPSWEPFLRMLAEKLGTWCVRKKDGYVVLYTQNHDLTVDLKNLAIDKNLPFLKRKWEKLSGQTLAERRKAKLMSQKVTK